MQNQHFSSVESDDVIMIAAKGTKKLEFLAKTNWVVIVLIKQISSWEGCALRAAVGMLTYEVSNAYGKEINE